MNRESLIGGLSLTSGSARGSLWIYKEPGPWGCDRSRLARDQERREEVRRFRWALDKARSQIEGIRGRVEKEGETAEILSTHAQLLRDQRLVEDVEWEISKSGWRACFALKITLQKHLKKLADDRAGVERLEISSDLRDVANRLGQLLTEKLSDPWSRCPRGSVVICREMLPSVFAQAAPGQLIGLVSQVGGETSHLAIMARAREIPFLSKVKFSAHHWVNRQAVILDADRALIICNPSVKTLRGYRAIEISGALPRAPHKRAIKHALCDGTRLQIAGNAESVEQVQQLVKGGAVAIGLFRSEGLVFKLRCFPSERQQVEFYRKLVEGAAGKPLTVRLFDIGGDKAFDWSQRADRSALGLRGIGYLLRHRRQLRRQLRALASLRADRLLSILIPMVSRVEEIEQVRAELVRACEQLHVPAEHRPRLGCMLEVPSSALIMDQLAPQVDFFSLGTNDLCQYMFAVDRNHAERSPALAYHPAILRVIAHVTKQARRLNKPVSICGEMCSDSLLIPLLIGLGVRNFSVSPAKLPQMSDYLRGFTLLQAKLLAGRALQLTSAEQIRRYLKSARADFALQEREAATLTGNPPHL